MLQKCFNKSFIASYEKNSKNLFSDPCLIFSNVLFVMLLKYKFFVNSFHKNLKYILYNDNYFYNIKNFLRDDK